MLYYIGGNTFITGDGKKVELKPYFYIIGSSIPKPKGVVIEEVDDLTPYVWDGVGYRESDLRVFRAYAEKPGLIPQLREHFRREGFRVSQSYIKYALRHSIDRAFKSKASIEKVLNNIDEVIRDALSRMPRFMALDVEVVNGEALYGYTFDGESVSITPNMEDVLKDAVDADLVVTYNGWYFDTRYLQTYNNSPYAIKTPDGPRPVMDLFVFVGSGFKAALGLQEEASKLYDVAIQLGIHRELGLDETRLLRYKIMQARVGSAHERALKAYLMTDVKVTYKLASRWLPILQALGAITGSNPHVINQVAETASPGHLAEALYHKYLELNGIVLEDREREYAYEAGDKTRARAPGTFRNVGEYDFSAMYPSLYTQDHVDPINIRECESGFPVSLVDSHGGTITRRICFEPGGLIHKVLASLYRARKVTKALKAQYGDAPDQAVKILVNAAYGVFGKGGIGMINEFIAAYIAQKTQAIFDDLWNRYQPIYGDTDSMYIELAGRDPNKLLEEINDYLHKTYGELMEMKLEDIWEIVYIPRGRGGGPVEKNYIKLNAEKVVIKGGALKPRDLPRGLRYGPYRDWVRMLLRGEARLEDLIREFTSRASLEDLFIEESMMYRELLYTNEGTPIKSIDRSRFPILAGLALEWYLRDGKPVNIDLNAREVNGKPIDLDAFVDVLYLPVDTQGRVKSFIILPPGGKPQFVRVSISTRGGARGISNIIVNVTQRPVDVPESEVRRRAARIIRESGLFSHMP